MQLLPNVYLVDGFAYAQHANFYLVQSEQGTVVIDAGTLRDDLDRAEQQLSPWGISLARVDYLLLTHSHYDHVGNAAELRRRGAMVVAGRGDTRVATILGVVAVIFAMINVVGGFMVTDRMLHMFKAKPEEQK